MENNMPNNQQQNYSYQVPPQQMPPQQFPQYQPMPPQQKPKKPIHKKWWFWVIIVIVVLIIGSALGGSSESDDNKTTENSSVSQQSENDETTQAEEPTEKTTTKKETTTKFSKKSYKEKCKKIAYKDLARDPDKHEGKKVKFTGEVIQVIESTWGNSVEYRISVSKESWGYSSDEVVYVTYTPSEKESRILEDDIVTFYGEYKGLYSYNSTLGGKITIPQVEAKVIELQ